MLAALIVMFSRFASRVMQCTERKLMDNIAELSHCVVDTIFGKKYQRRGKQPASTTN